MLALGRLEQPSQDKISCFSTTSPTNQTRKGPLSFALLESPFTSVSTRETRRKGGPCWELKLRQRGTLGVHTCMKGVLSWLVRGASCAGTIDFVLPWMLKSAQSKILFSLPHNLGSRAGSPVSVSPVSTVSSGRPSLVSLILPFKEACVRKQVWVRIQSNLLNTILLAKMVFN